MDVRKLVWLAFTLVLLGFLGITWLALRPPPEVKTVEQAALVVEPPPPVKVQVEQPVAVTEKVWLLCAKHNLAAGIFLRVDDFTWCQVSKQQFEAMIAPLEKGVAEPSLQVGGLLQRPLKASQPLSSLNVLKPGDNGYLAALITPGMRALSIEVNQVDASYRLVSPGDKVDVIMSMYLNGGDGGSFEDVQTMKAKTLLVNRRVLAVDDNATNLQLPVNQAPERSDEPKAVITLEVSSEETELLALATSMNARFTISTRSPHQSPASQVLESRSLNHLLSEIKLAGPQAGLVLMRGIGTDYVGQTKEKKEADEE